MGITEAADVRAVIGEMIGALNASDTGRLRPLLWQCPDAGHIDTDPAERQTGTEILDEAAASGGSDTEVGAGDLDVHILGAVAPVRGRGRFTQLQQRQAAGPDDRRPGPRAWPVDDDAVACVGRGPGRGHLQLARRRRVPAKEER
jgi:hypothetical protein